MHPKEIKTRKALIDDHLDEGCLLDACSEAVKLMQDLEEELKDISDSHRKVMEEKCPSDEQHCTCVPILRKGIEVAHKTIRQQADTIQDLAKAKGATVLVPMTDEEAKEARRILDEIKEGKSTTSSWAEVKSRIEQDGAESEDNK